MRRFRFIPRTHSAPTPPTRANGTLPTTRRACLTELKVRWRSKQMRLIATGTINVSRVARSWFSNWPPYSMKYPGCNVTPRSDLRADLGDKIAQVPPPHIRHHDMRRCSSSLLISSGPAAPGSHLRHLIEGHLFPLAERATGYAAWHQDRPRRVRGSRRATV